MSKLHSHIFGSFHPCVEHWTKWLVTNCQLCVLVWTRENRFFLRSKILFLALALFHQVHSKPWQHAQYKTLELFMLYILYIFQVSTEFHIWWKLLVHKVSSGISVVVVTTVTGLDFGYVYLSSQLSILFCFYFSPCTPVGFTSNLSKFPLHIFSATHVPNQFFILSSIYNHVSRQFALVFCFCF